MAANRGSMGSGHGWAGAQMVFWNCAAPLILVMQPPTAQNFAIGLQATEVDNSKRSPVRCEIDLQQHRQHFDDRYEI